MQFLGNWTPEGKKRIGEWCEEISPFVACDGVEVRHEDGPTIMVGTPRGGTLLAGDDAFSTVAEMVVKRELARPTIEAAVQRVRESAETPSGARRPSAVLWHEQLAAFLEADERRKPDDAYELVIELASEAAAGTTIGHVRRGPGQQDEKRLRYYRERGYEPPVVQALERAVQECRGLKGEGQREVECLLGHGFRGLFQARVNLPPPRPRL